MYVCLCNGVKESDVREAGRAGCVTPCQLKSKLGFKQNGCCGRCAKNINELVKLAVQAASDSCTVQEVSTPPSLLPLR